MSASSTGDRHANSGIQRWIFALKPASWPKLLVPAVFGQILGASASDGLDLPALGWGIGFTALGLGFIVLVNDWADREVDSIKRKMFPEGCSPKTIPDGILGVSAVGIAGALSAGATVLAAVVAEQSLQRPLAFEAGLSCVLIFVAYTLPPIRLNYRGGGELLEMLGVGLALPLYNVYLQAGSIVPRAWPWIGGFSVLSLASGIASGLSDEESDRVGGKRTFASTFGNAAARQMTEACVVLGAGAWVVASLSWPDSVPIWVAGPAVGIVAWNFGAMRRMSKAAVTRAFGAQGMYKRFLHRAIWHSTMMVSALLWLEPALA
jgi:1,4-dihydroxy-2-naphthoate octaprenyltransferase/chlorophyll synthase